MNLALISFAILLGWSCLLSLPWFLTGNPNPLDSTAGYIMVVPLLIPIWFLGESGGGRCPEFTHSRLKWITRNSRYSHLKFFAVGFVHGLLFAIPSAMLITLAVAYSLNLSSITSLIILMGGGLIHLALFVVSFFVALQNVENWGRRIFRANQKT